jgi:hypothetical protein
VMALPTRLPAVDDLPCRPVEHIGTDASAFIFELISVRNPPRVLP